MGLLARRQSSSAVASNTKSAAAPSAPPAVTKAPPPCALELGDSPVGAGLVVLKAPAAERRVLAVC